MLYCVILYIVLHYCTTYIYIYIYTHTHTCAYIYVYMYIERGRPHTPARNNSTNFRLHYSCYAFLLYKTVYLLFYTTVYVYIYIYISMI